MKSIIKNFFHKKKKRKRRKRKEKKLGMDESVKQFGAIVIVIAVILALIAFATNVFIPKLEGKMNSALDDIGYVAPVVEVVEYNGVL